MDTQKYKLINLRDDELTNINGGTRGVSYYFGYFVGDLAKTTYEGARNAVNAFRLAMK